MEGGGRGKKAEKCPNQILLCAIELGEQDRDLKKRGLSLCIGKNSRRRNGKIFSLLDRRTGGRGARWREEGKLRWLLGRTRIEQGGNCRDAKTTLLKLGKEKLPGVHNQKKPNQKKKKSEHGKKKIC